MWPEPCVGPSRTSAWSGERNQSVGQRRCSCLANVGRCNNAVAHADADSRRCGSAYAERSNPPDAWATPLCEGEARTSAPPGAVSLFQGEALKNVNRGEPPQIKVGSGSLGSGSGARSAYGRGLAQAPRVDPSLVRQTYAVRPRFARRNRTGPKGRLTDLDLSRDPPFNIFQGFALKKCTAHSEGMRRGSAPERASHNGVAHASG